MKEHITQEDSMEFNHRVIVEQKAGNNGFFTVGYAWNDDEDKDEKPCIFLDKPEKGQNSWYNSPHGEFATINEFYEDLFPFNKVQWEDKEPTKVELTIKICD